MVQSPRVAECYELLRSWHPTKNELYDPTSLSIKSHKKVWWLGECGHEWQTEIRVRTRGRNCPYCAGNRVCESNCLATLNPGLAKEWHPTKNGELTPCDITKKSNRKVWWQCSNLHEWEATVCMRSRNKCPYCSGKRACNDNCLATTNPKIASQWHYDKNGSLQPADVRPGSDKKVWWICQHGHEWRTTVKDRTIKNSGCPYCAGWTIVVTPGNCLAACHPDLAAEWHPIKNGNLTPFDVVHSLQGKRPWWLGKCGHEWQVRIWDRIGGHGCPYCANRKVYSGNCLATNYPEIAQEWHPTKNGDLTPKDVIKGSKRKVWWVCRREHEWMAGIYDRTASGSGCPSCMKSKGEGMISFFLKKHNIVFHREYKFDGCVCRRKLRFDFALMRNDNVVGLIEYNGKQHYEPIDFGNGNNITEEFEKIKQRDAIKSQYCKVNGISFLVIPFWEFDNIETLVTDFCFKHYPKVRI